LYHDCGVATPRIQLQRSLRVAFSAEELRILDGDPEFSRALAKCCGSPEEIEELVKLGGSKLTARTRGKSQFGRKPECQ
jgi:hypothetical protein